MSAFSLTTRDGAKATCSIDRLSEFRSRMKGSVLVVGDPQYDEARRIWNGAHDKRPELIARCAGVADVIEAVDFGRDTGALVAIRGGGHNVAGTSLCDGGLVIDLSPMKGIRVDPAGVGAGGRHLGRSRSRNAGIRVDDPGRQHFVHRHRRLDARRWYGLVPSRVRHERR
jgi:hypothetical protein